MAYAEASRSLTTAARQSDVDDAPPSACSGRTPWAASRHSRNRQLTVGHGVSIRRLGALPLLHCSRGNYLLLLDRDVVPLVTRLEYSP